MWLPRLEELISKISAKFKEAFDGALGVANPSRALSPLTNRKADPFFLWAWNSPRTTGRDSTREQEWRLRPVGDRDPGLVPR